MIDIASHTASVGCTALLYTSFYIRPPFEISKKKKKEEEQRDLLPLKSFPEVADICKVYPFFFFLITNKLY